MTPFFRNIRQVLLNQSKISKYLIYAIGEIILVVIGILIALQINNNNENNKTRLKEKGYLGNIKTDLQLSITEIDDFILQRNEQVIAANNTIDHFEGKPVLDWNAFNKDIVNIYTWQRFFLIDNTFQELINSGNFGIIKNDSIKKGLQNLEMMYKKLKYNEDHFRYDAEVTLYQPSYEMLDINPMAKNFFYQVSGGKMGENILMKKELFGEMLSHLKQKNGFVFASLEFSSMITRFEEMKAICNEIISLIDRDLED